MVLGDWWAGDSDDVARDMLWIPTASDDPKHEASIGGTLGELQRQPAGDEGQGTQTPSAKSKAHSPGGTQRGPVAPPK